MDLSKIKHIHLMGIGGSACSAVAILLKNEGFNVSGCDLAKETPYLDIVKKAGIKVYEGHDKSHLEYVDVLGVSPAIVYTSSENSEYLDAKKDNKLEIWDQIVGDFLLKDKNVVCVTGTHGKSTTSSLAALVFEKAKLDPGVLVGAKLKEWNSNYRTGKDDYFIIEADDFYEKFLSYKPSSIIINNIEFDHPDFFKSDEHMIESYYKFVKLLEGPKNLIVNQDSIGIKNLFQKLGPGFLKTINVYGYTLINKPLLDLENSTRIQIVEKSDKENSFGLVSTNFKFDAIYNLSIPGQYNMANATGVIILSKLYGIKDADVISVLKEFKGIGRRMELIGEKNGIKIYDDYAHHPTAIRETLKALRQKYPKNRITVVDEPHSYSRTKALLSEYKGVFDSADRVIIASIYKARDKETFGVSEEILSKAAEHKDISVIKDNKGIVDGVVKGVKSGDVIIVMGAGKSYLLARDILAYL